MLTEFTLQMQENTERAMSDMNIVVIDATDGSQTSCLHQLFNLSHNTNSSPKPHIHTLNGTEYAVHFSKLSLPEIRYTNGRKILWPMSRDAIGKHNVHAAVVVYEVTRTNELLPIPRLLGKYFIYFLQLLRPLSKCLELIN